MTFRCLQILVRLEMPKVSERALSYGEVLDSLHKSYKRTQHLKEIRRTSTPRKKKRKFVPHHEYSYENIIQHIRSIKNEES